MSGRASTREDRFSYSQKRFIRMLLQTKKKLTRTVLLVTAMKVRLH